MSIPEFRAAFPEFGSTADGPIEDALEEGLVHHSATLKGQLLVAAHLLALSQESTGGSGSSVLTGDVASVSVAGQSVSVVPQSERGRDAFYASTRYGRRYLALRRSRSTGVTGGVYR